MSIYLAESELRRARASLEDGRKRQASEEKKAADADKAAVGKEQSAARASSASMKQSYTRDAQRKRDEATKARSKAAEHSGKVAAAQTSVHTAEVKLAKAQAAEVKKQDDARAKREAAERRQRDQMDRLAKQAAREAQRAEQSRRSHDAALRQRVDAIGADAAVASALVASRPWESVPEKITVLLMTAEPDGAARLRIDREIRQIQDQVRSSEMRDSIRFEYRPATRVADLLQHLNEVQPDVVHFSGHGANAGIAVHDAADQLHLLTNDQLGQLLAVAPRPLKLVVFNSCNSATQARVAVEYAAAAVGMEQSIEDETARVFAGQLYNSLGFGRTIGLAFEQAKVQVQIMFNALSGDPVLVTADGVDPDEFVVVSPSAS